MYVQTDILADTPSSVQASNGISTNKEQTPGPPSTLPHWTPHHVNPRLSRADKLVLDTLSKISTSSLEESPIKDTGSDAVVDSALSTLAALKDPAQSDSFEAPVFTTWDNDELVEQFGIPPALIAGYVSFAQGLLRKPADVVFVTHSIIYLATLPVSAFFLFTSHRQGLAWWAHAVLHTVYAMWSAGPFTLML